MGRNDARPMLLRLLQQAPSAAVIDAISAIADEECLVILGRIAPTRVGDGLIPACLYVVQYRDRRFESRSL